ncbi:transglutaminase domain-containing protein [Sphingobacterium sp.]|uniref:transglutaminase domain-containing protein n=1 Tax=Sphingobacterium sp. TaxID=341027 RepID=UPI002FDE8991
MKIIVSVVSLVVISLSLLRGGWSVYYQVQYFNDLNNEVAIDLKEKNLKEYIVKNNLYYQIQKKEEFISPLTHIENYYISKKLANYPWSKNLEYRYVQDYLFPRRIGMEKYQDWKKLLNKKFEGLLDSLSRNGINNRREVAICILKDLNSWFLYDEDIIFNRYPSVQELLSIKRGECYTISYISVMALRSAGIPAALDFCPFWSNKKGGHTEFVFLNDQNLFESNVNTEHKNGLKEAPKVYRLLSKENPEFDFLKNKTIHKDLAFLSDICYADVTDEHTSVNQKTVYTKDKKLEGELIYACVYSGRKWHPVAVSLVKNSSVIFKNLNNSIAYKFAFLKDDILYEVL